MGSGRLRLPSWEEGERVKVKEEESGVGRFLEEVDGGKSESFIENEWALISAK